MPVTNYVTVKGRIVSQNHATLGYASLMRDPLGNVIATANSAGTKANDTTYWPYGDIRTGGVSATTPFGFCGTWGYYTDSSGRQYVRARYYRPTLGRWQTVDPLWPDQSAFRYVDGRVCTSIDPFGKATCEIYQCQSMDFKIHTSLCAKTIIPGEQVPMSTCHIGFRAEVIYGEGKFIWETEGKGCPPKDKRFDCFLLISGDDACVLTLALCECARKRIGPGGTSSFLFRQCYDGRDELMKCACDRVSKTAPKRIRDYCRKLR